MSQASVPPASPIDEEQQRFYDQNGYLVLRDLFGAGELAVLEERFLALVEQDAAGTGNLLVMRDVMIAKGAVKPGSPSEAIAKLQDLHHDPVFFERYMKSPTLLDRVECFVGPDIKSIHSMLINKPPHVDGRHPLHQDLLYFPFRPADRIVATWTALEPCTRENGCLAVVPGSHKGELLEHVNMDWDFVNLAYFGARGVGPHPDRVHLEMNPGDTVFFHPLLLHGSGRNRSPGFRRAISAHYASAECRFLPGAESIGKVRPYLLLRGHPHPHRI